MKHVCALTAVTAALAFASCASNGVQSPRIASEDGIRAVATVAVSFGDGEKVSEVSIAYTKALAESIDAASYSVTCVENGKSVARTIERVSVEGDTVRLYLAYVNKWDATNGEMPKREPKRDEKQGAPKDEGPRFDDDGIPVDVSATVVQVRDVLAADGTVFTASTRGIRSTQATERVIADFSKQYFTDDETGITLPYFVYLPRDYDEHSAYPLVFFIPDASADTSIETATLTQGNGATVWATAAEQEKHPAIVVAVQYPYAVVKEYGALTTDAYRWTQGLTAVDNLLQSVIERYAVDKSRIYGTGQSQGCMSNIALSDRHPDLFAAQFLVAGQWDVEEMAAMKDKKLWIVVCEGDEKAFPGMTAAVEKWESLGAKVARWDSYWNPKASAEEMQANVAAMLAKDADIRMNVFAGGSHMYTWSLAYNIEGIRDWLFAQKK